MRVLLECLRLICCKIKDKKPQLPCTFYEQCGFANSILVAQACCLSLHVRNSSPLHTNYAHAKKGQGQAQQSLDGS